ncbi:MAG: two pore domain potassium channel family protein [Chloroflexi bacterium]|nr:two pore domain potassium channel family protein [Chloroflexota bacterium]
MTEEASKRPYQTVASGRPGDRVLRVRVRKHRLAAIKRQAGGSVAAAVELFADIFTQTAILPVIGLLTLLVIIVPVPMFLIERSDGDAEITSYWIGLWWAVSAFTTVGHSEVGLVTAPGRVVGSVFTVLSVALFFGSVIAAFSSYFLLTWRRPKRQVIDTVTYYLQRIDLLTTEELEELEDLTAGVLHIAKERAKAEERHSPDDDESLEDQPGG